MNKALDAYSLRMTTSAKNIANANTTGYKPERVKFEELFKEQMAIQGTQTNERHIPVGRLPEGNNELAERIVPVTELMKSGENNFDIDKEMAEVAETQIRYQFVSQSLSKHFKTLSAAITGNASY
jgi:flagellar basal-body rod protein FlgB